MFTVVTENAISSGNRVTVTGLVLLGSEWSCVGSQCHLNVPFEEQTTDRMEHRVTAQSDWSD